MDGILKIQNYYLRDSNKLLKNAVISKYYGKVTYTGRGVFC